MKHLLLILLFISTNLWAEKSMQLHPDFPIIEGEYQITKDWSISLDTKYNRRIEDGSMVIWRPGITIWLNVWNNDHYQSIKQRIIESKEKISKSAYEYSENIGDSLGKIDYLIDEKVNGKIQTSLTGLAFNKSGYLQSSFYFDKKTDKTTVKKIFDSIKSN